MRIKKRRKRNKMKKMAENLHCKEKDLPLDGAYERR
jgi:hypothetical protein